MNLLACLTANALGSCFLSCKWDKENPCAPLNSTFFRINSGGNSVGLLGVASDTEASYILGIASDMVMGVVANDTVVGVVSKPDLVLNKDPLTVVTWALDRNTLLLKSTELVELKLAKGSWLLTSVGGSADCLIDFIGSCLMDGLLTNGSLTDSLLTDGLLTDGLVVCFLLIKAELIGFFGFVINAELTGSSLLLSSFIPLLSLLISSNKDGSVEIHNESLPLDTLFLACRSGGCIDGCINVRDLSLFILNTTINITVGYECR